MAQEACEPHLPNGGSTQPPIPASASLVRLPSYCHIREYSQGWVIAPDTTAPSGRHTPCPSLLWCKDSFPHPCEVPFASAQPNPPCTSSNDYYDSSPCRVHSSPEKARRKRRRKGECTKDTVLDGLHARIRPRILAALASAQNAGVFPPPPEWTSFLDTPCTQCRFASRLDYAALGRTMRSSSGYQPSGKELASAAEDLEEADSSSAHALHGYSVSSSINISNNPYIPTFPSRAASNIATPIAIIGTTSTTEQSLKKPSVTNPSSRASDLQEDADLDDCIGDSDFFNRVISCRRETKVCIGGEEHVVPPDTIFCMSDVMLFKHVRDRLRQSGPYDVILLDPPWENASARRSQAYSTLPHQTVLRMNVDELCRPGTLIAVWVTNRPAHIDFVRVGGKVKRKMKKQKKRKNF